MEVAAGYGEGKGGGQGTGYKEVEKLVVSGSLGVMKVLGVRNDFRANKFLLSVKHLPCRLYCPTVHVFL